MVIRFLHYPGEVKMFSRQPSRPRMPDLERVRWLGVCLPIVVLCVLFSLLWAHHLHSLFDVTAHLFGMAVIIGGAYLFSRYVFRIVQQKEQVILRRNQELSALHTVGAEINKSLDLDAVLSRALDRVLEVTGAEAGEIFLREAPSQELVLKAFQGLYPEAFQEITRFKPNEGFPGWIALAGKPLVVHDLGENPRFLRGRVKQAGFQSFAGLPLRSKGEIVGVMGIFALDPRRLKSEDVELLAGLGNQIGIAIENAKLYGQVREMTIQEERQRIAREMHDGLAQELGYLYLKIEKLEAHQSTPAFLEEIRLMKKVTAGLYDEVRHNIFGLKLVSRDKGLVPALTEYLRDFSEQTGISVELKIADEGATRLFPHVEIQLIRIIQEAFANIRKHAQAGHAWVNLEMEGSNAKVAVQDDGEGFDPTEARRLGSVCFGLQSMQERAELVGGTFRVESQPGKGTQVIVWLPRGGEEVASWRP